VTDRKEARMYRHKEKQNNLKGVRKSMDTTNMLELAKLYHSMGDTKRDKEIMHSTHSEMMKPIGETKLSSSSKSDSCEVEALSSEAKVEASDTPTPTTIGSTASCRCRCRCRRRDAEC
jgi:hypothetical protein